MILHQFVFDAGPLEVNHFIMGDEESRDALLVDAGVYAPSVDAFLHEHDLCIRAILLTHLHADHADALGDYLAEWASSPPAVFSPAPIEAAPAAQIVVEGGPPVQVGPFGFSVFKTSGHTSESISYYCQQEGLCFVGDAIFAGAVGGTKSDELFEEEIGHLRRCIMTLPPETELYSGHGPATTVAVEKAANPFLQPGFKRTA